MDVPPWAVEYVEERARHLAGEGMHPADAVSEAAWEVAGEISGRSPDFVRQETAEYLSRRASEPSAGDLDFSGVDR